MEPHVLHHDAEQLLSLFCENNPNLIRLHVAENVLLFDRLNKIFTSDCKMKLEDIKYQSSYGPSDLRGEIAAFLSRSFALEPAITADNVSCFAGTRCALEVSARAVFEDSTGGAPNVLMPAPYWQGFKWIYEDRFGGRIVPVPLSPKDNFALTLDGIREAYESCKPLPRALILTQPNNPLGINYAPRLLEQIYGWVLGRTKMHVFSDEIYAHCQMNGIRRSQFKSALALPIARDHPERVHVAWGFAKDFGVSGFRVGVLASRSDRLHKAVRAAPVAGFSPMTSSNTWLLHKLFASAGSRKPADELMEKLAPRLKTSFEAVNTVLDDRGIPRFQRTHAAQFVWLDLRRWLDRVPSEPLADSRLAQAHLLDLLAADPREKALHAYLCAEAGVSLLPGQTLATEEPGFFRLCFTAAPKGTVEKAARAIADALDDLK